MARELACCWILVTATGLIPIVKGCEREKFTQDQQGLYSISKNECGKT